jgi:MerR family transcriptional regulator, thiopeptide resistance regulator
MEVGAMAWTVGETARLAKVSVRTLHHYDELGLLSPSARSDAGYRLYESTDLERLHQVLLFRELGFSLDDIRRIMLDPTFDRDQALRAQRTLLAQKVTRAEAMLAAIDVALETTEKGTMMSDQERADMFGDLFDGFNPSDYEEEARERWGETDAYKQSAERTKRYTKADWVQIKAEMDENTAAFVAVLDAGIPADSPEAMGLAEAKREHISKWFYDLPISGYENMAAIWVNDPRFTRNIDKARPGLAAYSYAAVQALVASKK